MVLFLKCAWIRRRPEIGTRWDRDGTDVLFVRRWGLTVRHPVADGQFLSEEESSPFPSSSRHTQTAPCQLSYASRDIKPARKKEGRIGERHGVTTPSYLYTGGPLLEVYRDIKDQIKLKESNEC